MRQRLIIGAVLLALAVAAPARAEQKFAYVDVQRALNECDAGKRAKADMQGRIQVLDSRLQKQQSEVQTLRDELEKKGMLMQPDQRQSLQEELQKKATNFDRDYKDSRDELQRKDNEITGKIVHDLATVIRSIGERDGFTMVMEKGSILWGAPGIDITDEVIRNYNAKHVRIGTLGEPGSEAAASAAPPGDFGGGATKRSSISK
ncbi:MAG TPA: OmpH family outer membrane protein [Candidatus Binataceae bacterium]|nr:OmpH family outer membrane protein [Candidatus Binataceae bacterium]